MRWIVTFFSLGFWSAYAQEELIKVDTSAAVFNDYRYAVRLDSLLQAEFTTAETDFLIAPPQHYAVDIPTDTLKNRLKALNSKTPLSIVYNPNLERLIHSFLKNRRSSLESLMYRSQYYFPLFEEILEREGLPLEIKYLAIVESALRPSAKSAAGATGLWQFMFSTAKHYNLEVSSYVDERCNPTRSTAAASQYLKKLYSVFEDWNLALAAYNAGPGNITKAMRRSGGHRNYWNIRPFLPRETASYIPVFLATLYIFEYAEEHGFHPPRNILSIAKTDTVRIKKTIHFEHLKKVVGLDLETVKFLNPEYKLNIVPLLKDRNYSLRLPIDLLGIFISNEAEIYQFAQRQFEKREKPLPKFYKMDSKIRYKVRPGDYLGKLANKFGVRISEIKRWNGKKSDGLKSGDLLTIYTRNLDYQLEPTNSVNSNQLGRLDTYVVEKGDSLWSISQKIPGISVQNLQKWNGISGKDLKPGMKLIISK